MDANIESKLKAAFVNAQRTSDGKVLISSLGTALKNDGFEFTGKLISLLREYAWTESNPEGIFYLYEDAPIVTPGSEYVTLVKSSPVPPQTNKISSGSLTQKTGNIQFFDVEKYFGVVASKDAVTKEKETYTFLGTTQHINNEILNDLLSTDAQKRFAVRKREIKFETFMRLGKECATKIRYIDDFSREMKTIRLLVSAGNDEKAIQEYEDLLKLLVVPNNAQTISELINELIHLYIKIATDEYMGRAEKLINDYKDNKKILPASLYLPWLLKIYKKSNKIDLARACLEELIKINDHPSAKEYYQKELDALSGESTNEETPSAEQHPLSGKGYIIKFPHSSYLSYLGIINSDNGEYPFVTSNASYEVKELLRHPDKWKHTPVEFDILPEEQGKRKTTNLRISGDHKKTQMQVESETGKTPEDSGINNAVPSELIKDGQLTPALRKSVLEEIKSNWRQEGGEEDSKYFYYRDEIKSIINGDKYYVIGRKGSGKSAIANYILERLPEIDSSVYADKIIFADSDFPEYKREKKGVLDYENECLLLIYKKFYELMKENSSDDNRDKLEKYIKSYSEDPKTGRLLRGEAPEKGIISSENQCEIYKKALLEYAGSASYYLTFDELDREYASYILSTDSNDLEKHDNFESLKSLLAGLFIAVRDFKEAFRKEKCPAENKKFYPIVFLRDDILDQITHPDRNKWKVDHGFSIDWNENNIKNLIAFRVSKAISPDVNYPFDLAWSLIFDQGVIKAGARGLKKKSAFNFISDLTQMRPRDFITYISKCADYELNSSVLSNDYLIKAKTVKTIGKTAFSDILRGDIEVEIQVLLPEYKIIFDLINKQSFSFKFPNNFI